MIGMQTQQPQPPHSTQPPNNGPYYSNGPPFLLLQNLIRFERQRTKALQWEGRYQMNYPMSNQAGWLRTIFVWHGRALDRMVVPFGIVMVHAILYIVLVQYVVPVQNNNDKNSTTTTTASSSSSLLSWWDKLHQELSQWEIFFSLVLNSTLALLLVFRLNRAAERFWLARQYWGDIIAYSRSLVSGILTHTTTITPITTTTTAATTHQNQQHHQQQQLEYGCNYDAIRYLLIWVLATKDLLRSTTTTASSSSITTTTTLAASVSPPPPRLTAPKEEDDENDDQPIIMNDPEFTTKTPSSSWSPSLSNQSSSSWNADTYAGLLTKTQVRQLERYHHAPMIIMDQLRATLKRQYHHHHRHHPVVDVVDDVPVVVMGDQTTNSARTTTTTNGDIGNAHGPNPLDVATIQHQYSLLHQNVMILDRFEEQLNALIGVGGGLERIKNTPLPMVYVSHLRTFLLVNLLLFPWVLRVSSWSTLPMVAICALATLGIEAAAAEVECPFGQDRVNALNMDAYVLHLLQIVQEQLQCHAEPNAYVCLDPTE